MSCNPKIIAFSDSWHLNNDDTRILLHQDKYSEGKTSLFIIEYDTNTKLEEINEMNTEELENNEYKFDELEDNIIDIISKETRCTLYKKWQNWFIIYFSNGHCMITTNDKIICEIEDEDTNYQSGDCKCELFTLNNGDMLIRNSGDVQSCILFTYHDPKVLTHELDHDECEQLDYEICSTCCTDVQDLEMRMIDDFVFAPVNSCEL